MQKWAPVKFVCSTASQSSFFMRIARPSRVTAALFTRISSRPNFSTTCLNPAFTCSASETSIFIANASPPFATISFTSTASFPSLRAATATVAPASDSASAVSRPIPCDAPVTTATLSFKLNITIPPGSLARILPFPLFFPTSSSRSVRPCSSNLFYRRRQALFVLDVQRRHRALDLPQQSRQHPPGPDFDKRIHALVDQQPHGLFPAHRHRNLPNQRLTCFVAIGRGVRIHIRHQRQLQIRKLRIAQILFQPLLHGHHQR